MDRILLSGQYTNEAEKIDLMTLAAEAVERSDRVLQTLSAANAISRVTTDPFSVDMPRGDGSGRIVIGTYGSPAYLEYFQGQFGVGMPGSRWKVENVVEFNKYAQLANRNGAAAVSKNAFPHSSRRTVGGLPHLSTTSRTPVNITGSAREVESMRNLERAEAAMARRGATPKTAEKVQRGMLARVASYNYSLAEVTGRAPIIKDQVLSSAFAIFSKHIDEGATPTVALAAARAVYATPPVELAQRLVEMYVEDEVQTAVIDFNKQLESLSGRDLDKREMQRDTLLSRRAGQKYLEVGKGIIDIRDFIAVGNAIYNKWRHTREKRGGSRRTRRKSKSKSKSKSKKRRHH